jgi:SNF2 family DNA or RNA helicase
MCRTDINFTDIHIIKNESLDTKHSNNKLLSKKDNLINIIKNKINGKFLIFSNYDYTNENISKMLDEESIPYSRLMGNINVINKIIERFSNGSIKVLLLNASNYGSGLNLQMATDVIIYHELDQELETQVIGRAQRLNRTEPLNVYYLLYEDEKSNCPNQSLDINIIDEII